MRDDERQLTDDAWAPLRDAVPEYAPKWQVVVAASNYDDTLPYLTLVDFAEFVVGELVMQQRDLTALGESLETLYTEAMINDDEKLRGLLTVGFLENLISTADQLGLELTRIEPLLVGPRSREAWNRAIAWERQGHVWEPGVGPVPTEPMPVPVGTVEVHRGRADRVAGVCRADVRLISGSLRAGYLLRRRLSKGSYSDWQIVEARQRTPELPDEFELELLSEREEGYDLFDALIDIDESEHPFWQVVVPASPEATP